MCSEANFLNRWIVSLSQLLTLVLPKWSYGGLTTAAGSAAATNGRNIGVAKRNSRVQTPRWQILSMLTCGAPT